MGSKQDRHQAQTDAIDAGSLAEVREILFGRNYREIQQQLADLHQRWEETSQSWRDSLQQQHTALENTVQREVGQAVDRLSTMIAAQAEQIHVLSQSLQSLHASFDAALRKLESRILQGHESLHDEMHDELQRVRTQLDAHVESMEVRLADELQTYRRKERRRLSELFDRFARDAEPEETDDASHSTENPWRRETGS